MKGYSQDRGFYYRRLIKKYIENPVYTVTKNQMRVIQFQKGDRVGRLTILGETESRKGYIYEKCKCDCGTIKFISRSHLRRWATKSCGCLRKEKSSERLLSMNTKHGMYGTHIYSTYMRAKDRCVNKNNHSYNNYGGRGIRFMWNSFEDFYNDMIESYNIHVAKYGKSQTTLDRINTDGDYCKDNCRWATNIEQQNNRRNNVKVIYKGKEYPSLQKICDEFGIAHHVLSQRLKNGWSINEAIETPVLPKGKNRAFIK